MGRQEVGAEGAVVVGVVKGEGGDSSAGSSSCESKAGARSGVTGGILTHAVILLVFKHHHRLHRLLCPRHISEPSAVWRRGDPTSRFLARGPVPRPVSTPEPAACRDSISDSNLTCLSAPLPSLFAGMPVDMLGSRSQVRVEAEGVPTSPCRGRGSNAMLQSSLESSIIVYRPNL